MPYRAPVPTTTPAIKNGPLISLAEGNGTFYNWQLAVLVLGVPYFVKRAIPLVCRGGFWTYIMVLLICGGPVTFAYWNTMSKIGGRVNDKVQFPGKDIEEYLDIKDAHLKKLYHGHKKIPIQVFYDAYFEGKIEVKGTAPHLCLEFNVQLVQAICWTLWNHDTIGLHLSSPLNCSNTSSRF